MSRTVIVDQDWQGAAASGPGSAGPAPAVLGGAFEAVAATVGPDGAFGMPLHVPGPGSRRASRTLSGVWAASQPLGELHRMTRFMQTDCD